VRIGVPIGATRSLTADRQTTSIPASNLRQHAKLSLASPVSLGRNVFTRPRPNADRLALVACEPSSRCGRPFQGWRWPPGRR